MCMFKYLTDNFLEYHQYYDWDINFIEIYNLQKIIKKIIAELEATDDLD